MEFFGNDKTPQAYHKKLAFEIIFQVRFQDLLKISNDTPLDFQYEMRSQGYPNFTLNSTSAVPGEIQQFLPRLDNLLNTYIFSSADPNRPYQIHLSKNFISIIHLGPYLEGDDFKNRFNNVLNSFVSIYGISDFTRVGLRHRNMVNSICISSTDTETIKSFVPDHIFPELSQNMPGILHLDKRYGIVHEGTIVNANYAWVPVSGNHGQRQFSNELSYIIDIDCFLQSNIQGMDNINESYARFDRQYSNIFDWSVSRSLIELISR